MQRPPRPAWTATVDRPETLPFGRVRYGLKRTLLYAMERGWLGLTPLQTHVVLCGFQRSGTTLLLLMAETCVSDAKMFGREARGYRMAQYLWRNHPVMITKHPGDIFWIDEIRAYYATRKPRTRFVVTTRDPRAVLTSFHARIGENQYFVTPERWRIFYEYYQYVRHFDDVITVEYADLVLHPQDVQKRLTDFIGWKVHRPFEQFHTAVPANFRTTALNGLRRLDPSALDRWKHSRHRDRIRHLLQEMPELPTRLIEMGYETDTSWTREYT